MSGEDDPKSIWENDCTDFLISRILLTFPKLSIGPKFEKAFRTEANRLVSQSRFLLCFIRILIAELIG